MIIALHVFDLNCLPTHGFRSTLAEMPLISWEHVWVTKITIEICSPKRRGLMELDSAVYFSISGVSPMSLQSGKLHFKRALICFSGHSWIPDETTFPWLRAERCFDFVWSFGVTEAEENLDSVVSRIILIRRKKTENNQSFLLHEFLNSHVKP